jgi:hypothetical protein
VRVKGEVVVVEREMGKGESSGVEIDPDTLAIDFSSETDDLACPAVKVMNIIRVTITKKTTGDRLRVPGNLIREKNREVPLRRRKDIKEHVKLDLPSLFRKVEGEVGKMVVKILSKILKIWEAPHPELGTDVRILSGMMSDKDEAIIDLFPSSLNGGVGKRREIKRDLFTEGLTPEEVGVNKIMTARSDMVTNDHASVDRGITDLVDVIVPVPRGEVSLDCQSC